MSESKDGNPHLQLWLIRHGQTQWSAAGRHTGRTNVALDAEGRREAVQLRHRLAPCRFVQVVTSPLQRAAETCRLAGYGDGAQQWDDLMEWDYGDYEGVSTDEVRRTRPGWTIWRDGVPNGETVAQVGKRADAVLAALAGMDGPVALFSHAHLLRILTARWLGLPPQDGRLLAMDTGAVSRLGHEHGLPVVQQWNLTADTT